MEDTNSKDSTQNTIETEKEPKGNQTMNYTLKTTRQQRKPGTKTVWQTVSTEEETHTGEDAGRIYNNIVSAAPFFRRLGGIESLQYNYTPYGYIVDKITSTSPDRQQRTIRQFEFFFIRDLMQE